jgi:hypothetical protein
MTEHAKRIEDTKAILKGYCGYFEDPDIGRLVEELVPYLLQQLEEAEDCVAELFHNTHSLMCVERQRAISTIVQRVKERRA